MEDQQTMKTPRGDREMAEVCPRKNLEGKTMQEEEEWEEEEEEEE